MIHNKVCVPKTNTMYHLHTLGAFKCMHVVHSVEVLRSVVVLGTHTLCKKGRVGLAWPGPVQFRSR